MSMWVRHPGSVAATDPDHTWNNTIEPAHDAMLAGIGTRNYEAPEEHWLVQIGTPLSRSRRLQFADDV